MDLQNALFLDTEFTELSSKGELISLAAVDYLGEQFYWEFTEWMDSRIPNDWVLKNVVNKLEFTSRANFNEILHGIKGRRFHGKGSKPEAANYFKSFIHDRKYEVWTDVAAYDWYWFCEIFGGSHKLPENISYISFDFATALKLKGSQLNKHLRFYVPLDALNELNNLPGSHHALYDACLLRLAMLNKVSSKTNI